MSYRHYGMVLIPAVVFPISMIFSDFEKIPEKNTAKALLLVSSLYLLSVVIIPNWIEIITDIPMLYERKDENHRNEVIQNVIDLIHKHTAAEDRISVYGNWDIIYVLSGRMHAGRYSYQFPIGQIKPEIMDEYMDALQRELPKVVVVQAEKFDENIQAFLENNNYEIQYSSKGEDLSSSALLFLRE